MNYLEVCTRGLRQFRKL